MFHADVVFLSQMSSTGTDFSISRTFVEVAPLTPWDYHTYFFLLVLFEGRMPQIQFKSKNSHCNIQTIFLRLRIF